MKVLLGIIVLMFAAVAGVGAQQPADAKLDTSPHKVQFVTVDKDVKLEVLDWGGTGRPLIFLAGLGNDAHVFDTFAPKFTGTNHVYGITRRGFGASSKPEPDSKNYSADRLGDDVLAVIDFLKLDHPVIAGHSIAGEELSSIGSRHPEKVAGLIYLDAGYSYAYYDSALGDTGIDSRDLRSRLDHFDFTKLRGPQDVQQLQELEQATARFDKDLQTVEKLIALTPPLLANLPPFSPIQVAIFNGEQKYSQIHVPVLAIFADPHNYDWMFKDNPSAKTAFIANDTEITSAQADAFQAGIPSSHVVRIANANHYVFQSNEAEVIREMNAFLAKLPQKP